MFLENGGSVRLESETEDALIAMAYEMGLIATPEEATILSEGVQMLNESQANIVRLNKQSKLNNFTVQAAIAMARERKDPLYTQFIKYAKLKREFREKIVTKYGMAAKSTAREMLANVGKKNLVDVSGSKEFSNTNG
jgi:hypothetical protein